ncbi:MAG: GNAT family N-acetyltransferase, partial [Trichormus sp.]
ESYQDGVIRHKYIYTISANPIVIKMMKDLNFVLFDNLFSESKINNQSKLTLIGHSVLWLMEFYRLQEIIRKSIAYKNRTKFVYGIYMLQNK